MSLHHYTVNEYVWDAAINLYTCVSINIDFTLVPTSDQSEVDLVFSRRKHSGVNGSLTSNLLER
mgnify:CR=1 FL=1